MFPTRYVRLDEARQRFGSQVDRLGAFLVRGDPLGDAAAHALMGHSLEAQRQLVDQLLRGDVKDLPEPLRALEAAVSAHPVWVDLERCARGGEVILRSGIVGCMVLAFKSLIAGYLSPAGNKPLILSGRLTYDAGKRLAETARFVEAVCLPGGMHRHGPGLAATLKVRLMHARVRVGLSRSPLWHTEDWGTPINQYDMAGTLLMFGYVMLQGFEQLGFEVTPVEQEDVLHLWRTVGHVIGAEEQLVCATLRDAANLWSLIQSTQGPPDDDSRRLAHAVVTGAPLAGEKAQALVGFGYALGRHLLGAEAADALGFPTTRWSLAPRLLKRIVRRLDGAAHRLPLGKDAALRAGHRTWRHVSEVRLGQRATHFDMPREATRRGRGRSGRQRSS